VKNVKNKRTKHRIALFLLDEAKEKHKAKVADSLSRLRAAQEYFDGCTQERRDAEKATREAQKKVKAAVTSLKKMGVEVEKFALGIVHLVEPPQDDGTGVARPIQIVP
jgi:hypothetical protein